MNQLKNLIKVEHRDHDIFIQFEEMAVSIKEVRPNTGMYKLEFFEKQDTVIKDEGTNEVITIVRYYKIKDEQWHKDLESYFLEKWFDYVLNTLTHHIRNRPSVLDTRIEALKNKLGVI